MAAVADTQPSISDRPAREGAARGRWTCRCATSPSARVSARRCSARSSAARRARRCDRGADRGGAGAALSQLLRLDEGGAVSVVRADERRGGGSAAAGTPSRSSRRRCPASAPSSAATCSRPAPGPAARATPPMHEPGSREIALVERRRRRAATSTASATRSTPATASPSTPIFHTTSRTRAPSRRPSWPSSRRASDGARARHAEPTRCSTRSGPPTRSPTTSSTSTCTSSTRSRAPQAFDGLRLAGRKVRRPDRTLATADHNVPTDGTPVAARIRRAQPHPGARRSSPTARSSASRSTRWAPSARASCTSSGPELGITQPGMTIVCGDSHTATHGAFGALAFGIGTSEVEHVLATQTLPAAQAEVDADQLRRAARPRRHRQGPDPRDHRQDRRRRRRRARHRVRRRRRSRRSRWKAA